MVTYSVYDLADEIFKNEYEFDTGYSRFFFISGWLANNIGQLNTKIFQDYSVSGNYFLPSGNFNAEERAIYKQIFLCQNYEKQARNTLRGIMDGSSFVSLKEGDSEITRINKNEVAKVWRGLARDAREDLDKLVTSYNMYAAAPIQVFGLETYLTGNLSQKA